MIKNNAPTIDCTTSNNVSFRLYRTLSPVEVSKSKLQQDVVSILRGADLNVLTRKMIQQELEQKYGVTVAVRGDIQCSLADRRSEIKSAISTYLTVIEAMEGKGEEAMTVSMEETSDG